MKNKLEKFSNKHFDKALEPFLKGLKEYFGLSTKGAFVFLASYGLKYPDCYEGYFEKSPNSDGPEWREEQDADYETAVDVLINTYSMKEGLKYSDVRTDAELLKKVVDELMKIANAVAKSWLDSTLFSFKKGVSDNDKGVFVQLIASYLKELNEDEPQF